MAILTFALGVGANAAVFSVADSVLFRPLPFADADRLLALRLADPATAAVYGPLPAATVDARAPRARSTPWPRRHHLCGAPRPTYRRSRRVDARTALMSAIVGQRTREYGVRVALGTTRGRVHRHVLGMAARPIGWGIAGGMLVALWAARFMSSLLYGVMPLDPGSFAAAGLVLLVSGVAAALVPAIRASRVDPVVALRAE